MAPQTQPVILRRAQDEGASKFVMVSLSNHAVERKMPHFLVQYWDKPGSGALRAPNRDAHIAYRVALGPKLVLAGPLFDDFNDAPPLGTVIIVDAPDKAEAKRIALDDPYYKAGVFGRVEVYAHRILALNPPPKD